MTRTAALSEQFQAGAGQQPVSQRCCAECGYTSDNNKHFKKAGDGHTCTTGHYEDEDGKLKRAKNPYAR